MHISVKDSQCFSTRAFILRYSTDGTVYLHSTTNNKPYNFYLLYISSGNRTRALKLWVQEQFEYACWRLFETCWRYVTIEWASRNLYVVTRPKFICLSRVQVMRFDTVSSNKQRSDTSRIHLRFPPVLLKQRRVSVELHGVYTSCVGVLWYFPHLMDPCLHNCRHKTGDAKLLALSQSQIAFCWISTTWKRKFQN